MITLILFFIVLGLLVFVHELGHFVTARIFGVKAEEFGFGLPPRICGWRKINGRRKFFWGNKASEKIESEDTVWSLNWLPIGGFVKIKGEDGQAEGKDSFAAQKPWKKAIILSAGVLMNFVFAMVLLSFAFMIGSPEVVNPDDSNAMIREPKIQILEVLKDSPAEVAGLETGDQILALDGQAFTQISEIQSYIATKENQEIKLTINHFGESQELALVPIYNEEAGASALGVQLVKTGLVSYPWYQSLWLGVKSTVLLTGQILVAFYDIIKNLLVGLPAGIEVSGPVGIAVMTGQAARLGLVYIIQFAAILSINLAIINFLPIPALDGGRVVFIGLEKIRRKPVSAKIENAIHTIGFALLLLLIVIVTSRDIFKFKDSFLNFFQKIIS